MSTSDLLQNQLAKSKKRPNNLQLSLSSSRANFDAEKSLFEIFRNAFVTNCHLDEASVTGEELETLDELSIEEVLENFNDLITDLLNFKREYKSTDQAELFQRSQKFESQLQKFEADVRNHISVEHQLKLHIESIQNKLEELERYKAETGKKVAEYEEKLNFFREKGRGVKEEKKDAVLLKFEVECSKLKDLLEEKVMECEKLKKAVEKSKLPKKSDKTSSSIEYLKKRLEDKANDLNRMQLLMKEKTERPFIKVIDKKNRKSHDEANRNTPSPFRARKETETTAWTESRPSTAKRTPSRSHVRSNSDQTRPFSTKKLII